MAFVGHLHVPVIFTEPTDDLGSIRYTFESEVDVSGAEKALINVGSVGQPRDEDPRAAYCIYDTEAQRVWIKRIAYDVDKAGRKIIKAGLPRMLAERLQPSLLDRLTDEAPDRTTDTAATRMIDVSRLRQIIQRDQAAAASHFRHQQASGLPFVETVAPGGGDSLQRSG